MSAVSNHANRYPHLDLWIARGLTLGPVALVFPVATAAVFAFGADRTHTADLVALCYSLGLFLGFSTSLWPLPSLSSWTRDQRIESLCLVFLIVSYITHLSWELVWLVSHENIAAARDSAWAYPWWAYIDGGDARYANPSSTLVAMEILSVTNGLIGAFGFYLWKRSAKRDPRAYFCFMATAVVHLYSVCLYYGSELLDGLVNVNTASFLDVWFKFGLANAPWLVCPPFVLYWGARQLKNLRAA